MKSRANKILKEIFGYDEFRPFQEDIILSVLNKRDTLAIMPTGSGKSICYQIPALIFDGLTIVVSPLISLMKDQIDQLKEYDIPAVMLNSSLDAAEYSRNVSLLRGNGIRLLYAAPETLVKPGILKLLSGLRVECIAIDESHCISEWGHDFRPEYRELGVLRSKFPSAVWLALTATATGRVRNDIVKNLELKDPAVYIAPFNRENLFLQVKHKNNSFSQLLDFLKEHREEPGIIYCLTRNTVEHLYARLSEYGFPAAPYHAGLSDEDRKKNHELFLRDEIQIITATIAFGMGVHKPNIRFVVHYDLPKSIESYYQEIGRAGRDGLPASCLLLYSYSDTYKIKYFINQKEDPVEKKSAELHLAAMVDYAETDKCRRIPLLKYFGENYTAEKCPSCDNCTAPIAAAADITIHAQMFLSCVKRVNESFGMNHIIDILHGSGSQKIMDFSHHKLSTYGIGKDHSKRYWQEMARQFIRLGLISQDADRFNVLRLSGAGYEVMTGKKKAFGRIPDEHRRREETKEAPNEAPAYDKELFGILRKKRKELADAADLPPYIIFSDKTLMEMATFFPQHKSSLMDIHGVGANKYEKFGDIFLGLVQEYCRENNIEERFKTTDGKPGQAKIYKYKIIGDEYNSGRSVNELISIYNVKQQTIFNHLYDYILNGYKLRAGGLSEFLKLETDVESRLLNLFDSLGVERLKPVFEALNGKVDYETLAVYRVYYLCSRDRKRTSNSVSVK